ncbi:glycosyltransferase family 76 protein [Thozetella sp. PMI_491]|nr:glycosyltransferase family 76 protein [Thozetella sp. PMI_491]
MRARDALQSPRLSILAAFAGWKLCLLGIACGATLVGDAYDTSGGLALSVLDFARPDTAVGISAPAPTWARVFLARLTSWDAIYFVAAARRWYEFEQEWAFGTGLPLVIGYLLRALRSAGLVSDDSLGDLPLESLVGVLVANASHLLSVLVLYQLGIVVWGDRKRSLLAAVTHVLSPAGLFLSAPYAESTCALLSFTGYLLLAYSCHAAVHSTTRSNLLTLLAGATFGLATAFRSNGILNGLPFAWEVVRELAAFVQPPQAQASEVKSIISVLQRLIVLGFSGMFVALGYVIPQAVAYQQFCVYPPGSSATNGPPRPWCTRHLPSIYAFVQVHYWNTGFLRYWTVSNLPLFLLAGPMLLILVRSGVDLVSSGLPSGIEKRTVETSRLRALVQSAAVAQVLLAVLAFTSYHVQIISRISSGSPLWYWWLAGSFLDKDKAPLGKGILTFMVMYASIQGVLFASFLPPA